MTLYNNIIMKSACVDLLYRKMTRRKITSLMEFQEIHTLTGNLIDKLSGGNDASHGHTQSHVFHVKQKLTVGSSG